MLTVCWCFDSLDNCCSIFVTVAQKHLSTWIKPVLDHISPLRWLTPLLDVSEMTHLWLKCRRGKRGPLTRLPALTPFTLASLDPPNPLLRSDLHFLVLTIWKRSCALQRPPPPPSCLVNILLSSFINVAVVKWGPALQEGRNPPQGQHPEPLQERR